MKSPPSAGPVPWEGSDPEVLVIGSGPNGLVAASILARAGLRVLVLESNPIRSGGAVGSEVATLPGFVHDVGAAFFPWGALSPAFEELSLARYGLTWEYAPIQSAHPAPDGSCASITRSTDTEETATFGDRDDTASWRSLSAWYAGIEPHLLPLLLRSFPHPSPLVHIPAADLARLANVFRSSGQGFARRRFSTEAARRVLPSLALHVDVGPADRFGAALGFVLGMVATTGGFPVPRGGAKSVAEALVGCLHAAGGRLQLGARVVAVLVRAGRASAVRLASGEEIAAQRAILADTDIVSLLTRLVGTDHVPRWVTRRLRRFRRGFGTFKVDWALDARVPWTAEAARRAAVVHTGDSLSDLVRFTREVRDGQLPSNPYLVIGQQSVADPTRAPAGRQTLWAYSRVPSHPPGGWAGHASAFADSVERRIEGLAPGFRQTILARRLVTPVDLEEANENLVGGDLGGGSNAWHRQLMFRPFFPYFRYRMPLEALYLCSSYAHPGPGVHGMCGYNAAHAVLRDLDMSTGQG